MKLILDFDNPYEMKITSTDDPNHWYKLGWLKDEFKCSLWYDDNVFVWEKEYTNLDYIIANVVANILDKMKHLQE